jgi:hypothetical protein
LVIAHVSIPSFLFWLGHFYAKVNEGLGLLLDIYQIPANWREGGLRRAQGLVNILPVDLSTGFPAVHFHNYFLEIVLCPHLILMPFN